MQTSPSQAMPNIPVTIFKYSESPDPDKHAQAWGAALILILFVLVISIVARILSARMRTPTWGSLVEVNIRCKGAPCHELRTEGPESGRP